MHSNISGYFGISGFSSGFSRMSGFAGGSGLSGMSGFSGVSGFFVAVPSYYSPEISDPVERLKVLSFKYEELLEYKACKKCKGIGSFLNILFVPEYLHLTSSPV